MNLDQDTDTICVECSSYQELRKAFSTVDQPEANAKPACPKGLDSP